MSKKIITTPDPRLREKSTKVKKIDDQTKKIIADMIKMSLDWEKGHPYELSTAMAAPQMGVNKRIIIVRDDLDSKDETAFTALINPEIIKLSGKKVIDSEGCLSVPFVYGNVPRFDKARIKAKLVDGTEVRIKADGQLARTLQHEIDHLDGILFIDRIKNDRNAFFELDGEDLKPLAYDDIINNKDLFPDD